MYINNIRKYTIIIYSKYYYIFPYFIYSKTKTVTKWRTSHTRPSSHWLVGRKRILTLQRSLHPEGQNFGPTRQVDSSSLIGTWSVPTQKNHRVRFTYNVFISLVLSPSSFPSLLSIPRFDFKCRWVSKSVTSHKDVPRFTLILFDPGKIHLLLHTKRVLKILSVNRWHSQKSKARETTSLVDEVLNVSVISFSRERKSLHLIKVAYVPYFICNPKLLLENKE